MPPKKGVKQRLGLTKKKEEQPSKMKSFCKKMFRSGRLSSSEIGEAAAAGSSATGSSGDVRRIASVYRLSEDGKPDSGNAAKGAEENIH